jgi:hypothetical protein
MALSNIFKEPVREITESVVGVVMCGLFLYGVHFIADWIVLNSAEDAKSRMPIVLGYIVAIFFLGLAFGALFLIHFIGEELCDALANRGLELRPRRRR